MSQGFERAQLLLAHGRPADAERELREGLAREPEDPASHAMLALCLDQLDRMDEALAAAQAAVGLAPEWAFTHYVRAVVLVDLERVGEADASLDEAISLDPHMADAFALKGVIRLARGEWVAAQEQADLALALDPEDESAVNVRAQALIKQGKVEEARATMASGLAMHPDAARTHLNQGWILLESGDHTGAMDHFAEALRLDPRLDAAREGYITALKAKHWFYRLFLGFQFRLARLSSGNQWRILIGLWLLSRVIRTAEQVHPEYMPVLEPLRYLYVAFCLLTWTADPLLELMLRFSPRGKHLLAPYQKLGAEVFGGAIIVALVAAAAAWFTHNPTLGWLAWVLGVLVIPIGATFQRPDPKHRRTLGTITAVFGAAGVVAAFLEHNPLEPIAFVVMLGAILAFVLKANSYAIRRPV
ncbi:MAG: hypothetical protein JWM80_3012 [Cyanobacteria bacterium RYN_339]|nr:hypothetical protein [Cyanobacteria bacterium RYN_339]